MKQAPRQARTRDDAKAPSGRTAERAVYLAQWLLPVALAGLGATLVTISGGPTESAVFAAIGGCCLGLMVAQLLRAATALGERPKRSAALREATSPARLRDLERAKQRVLRAIKEIELDAQLQKIGPEEAQALAAPLRERALRLLRELDEARVAEPRSFESEVDRAIELRLGRPAGAAEAPAAAETPDETPPADEDPDAAGGERVQR